MRRCVWHFSWIQGGTRIAYGEWQATRFEMEELMDVGKIDVAQPDVRLPFHPVPLSFSLPGSHHIDCL